MISLAMATVIATGLIGYAIGGESLIGGVIGGALGVLAILFLATKAPRRS